MKTCLRLTLFACLLLPLMAAAQPPPVQLPPCCEGTPFTIRIPVKVPLGMSVEYVWYKDGTAVTETPPITTRTASVTTVIAYTVPAGEAYGSSVYHFMYRLDDECCDAWSSSPKYALAFGVQPAQPSAVTGNAEMCAGATELTYSVDSVSGVSYEWTAPASWTITAGQNTSSITVTAGTAGGSISVTPSNSCGSGAARTLEVSTVGCGVIVCADITAPGVIDNAACTGITSAGSINDGACTGIISAGAINDGACTGITSAGSIKR